MVDRLVPCVVLAAVLAGCTASSSPPILVAGQPVASPYSGPMDLPVSDAENASLLERAGVAARALECSGKPYYGERGYFGPDLEAVQSDAIRVLEVFMQRDNSGALPSTGYRLERKDRDHALFSYDVNGRTKVAFVAVDHVRDSLGREGWAKEAWAECDPSELPDKETEALGIGVWEDTTGKRVPITTVQSFNGGQHCDWQDITFLSHAARSYVRDPNGKLAKYLRTTFQKDATLPDDAKDTGLRRDGRELWVVPGGAAAYLVGAHDVERWAGTKQAIACA